MNKLFLVLYLFFIPCIGYAQCADGSEIYGLTINGEDYNYLLKYNPVKGTSDTVVKIKGRLFSNTSAIDAYNGRYFTCVPVDSTDTAQRRIAIIDLNNGSITYSKLLIRYSEKFSMEYDMFMNKLVMLERKDSLKFYDIANDSFYRAGKLPDTGQYWNAKNTCYNQQEQQLIYAVQKPANPDTINIYTIDIDKGTLVSVAHYIDTSPLGNEVPFSFTYDAKRKKVNALKYIYRGFGTDMYIFLTINNLQGTIDSVTEFAAKPYFYPSQSFSVFDAWTDTYYAPFMKDYQNHASNFAFLNVASGKVERTIGDSIEMNLHQFYGAYDPVCKLRADSTLIVTYGNNYQWYIDGKMIPGATNQTYRPEQPGNYTAMVGFSCGRVGISNEVYSDIRIVHEQPVIVYGNAVGEEKHIIFNNPDKKEHSLILYNALGQLVQSYPKTTLNFIDVRKGNLAPGIYYFRLVSGGKGVGEGRLLML